MAERINQDGYFLNYDGQVDKTRSQERHEYWKAQIEQAKIKHKESWAKQHPGEALPAEEPKTIMVVEDGDCQWTIAEDAGADPVKTAYSLNEQFENPDLINKGEIVFVDKTQAYAVTDPTATQPTAHDNTDIFARQTDQGTEAATGAAPQNYDGVRGDVSRYVSTMPNDPEALKNLLLGPDWGPSDKKGTYGRQLVVEEYLKKFPVTASENEGRTFQFHKLKVDLGLGTIGTDGKYVDKTKDQIAEGLPANLQGSEKDAEVNKRLDLLNDINQAGAAVEMTASTSD